MTAQAGAFEVVAEAIEDGIVIAGGDSRIVWCNRGAAAMFGWTAADAVGRPLTALMPERYREAHLAGMARLIAGGEPRLIGHGPIVIEALGADGKEIPVELTLGRLDAQDGDERFVAVIRDVSERRRSEREREAQLAVARALSSATTIEGAAGEVISALAATLGWEFGAAWLTDETRGELVCAHTWSRDEKATEIFRQATRTWTFQRGAGLPGLAWARGHAVWLADATEEQIFQRVAAAVEAGLQGAVAIPIVDNGTCVGVLEFLSGSLATRDESFETILEATCDQFVQFCRRTNAEDALAEARRELDRQLFAKQQTVEINDNIIHWLVQITQALDAGDQRGAQRATHEALRHASRIITELQALPQPAGR